MQLPHVVPAPPPSSNPATLLTSHAAHVGSFKATLAHAVMNAAIPVLSQAPWWAFGAAYGSGMKAVLSGHIEAAPAPMPDPELLPPVDPDPPPLLLPPMLVPLPPPFAMHTPLVHVCPLKHCALVVHEIDTHAPFLQACPFRHSSLFVQDATLPPLWLDEHAVTSAQRTIVEHAEIRTLLFFIRRAALPYWFPVVKRRLRVRSGVHFPLELPMGQVEPLCLSVTGRGRQASAGSILRSPYKMARVKP
jgi:hypothetical protein